MSRVLYSLLLILGGCASETQAIAAQQNVPAQQDLIVTNGYIEMDSRRELRIYYDEHPDFVVWSSPRDLGYLGYIELAGGLRPGERKRLGTEVGSFQRNADGTLAIHGWAIGSPGYGEPATTTIERSDPQFRCYDEILPRYSDSLRHRFVTSDSLRVSECLAARQPS